MTKNTIHRLVFDIIIMVCIIQGWWFIALPLGIIAIWKFNNFIEIILFGFMYDILFGVFSKMTMWSYIGSIVTVIILFVFTFAKKIVRK